MTWLPVRALLIYNPTYKIILEKWKILSFAHNSYDKQRDQLVSRGSWFIVHGEASMVAGFSILRPP